MQVNQKMANIPVIVGERNSHSIWLIQESFSYWCQYASESFDRMYRTYMFSVVLIWPTFAATLSILMILIALSEPYTSSETKLEYSLNSPESALSFCFMAILCRLC